MAQSPYGDLNIGVYTHTPTIPMASILTETIVHFIHRYISSIVVWECKSLVHAKFLLTIDDFS